MHRELAVITGITGALGSAIAMTLAEAGYFVVGAARDAKRGRSLVRKIGVKRSRFYRVDVGSESSIRRMFSKRLFKESHLSAVITCAGILERGSVSEFRPASWKRSVRVNLSGVFFTLQQSLKLLEKQRGGLIIVIGSRWGSSGAAGAAVYATTKSALRAMVRSIQLEYANTPIRALLVSPGSVESRMSRSVDPSARGKLLDPRDVAELVLFLIRTPAHVIFDEIGIKAYAYDMAGGS